MEETVHALVDLDPDSIAVVARNENSQTVFTTSFNCNAEYKAILAFHLLSDIVTDIVRANRDFIFNDDKDETGDDDIE